MYTLAIGCTGRTAVIDTDIVIVRDITDSMTVTPTAQKVVSQLGLKANPWQSVRITTTYISDLDVNDVQVATLDAESQWTGNLPMRKAKIQQFIQQVQQGLDVSIHTTTRPYSIAFRTIARQANKLAVSQATHQYLLIYSDLMENSNVANFYDARTIARLHATPHDIENQLQAEVSLTQLHGLEMWFIYNPQSFTQNNTYMKIAGFYQHMLTAHGATTHIATKFQLL
ncbi:hypothetical protein KXQ82_01970 [Mucilaginibacter sp. HMF5004]|uniref:hypothetical protein n=1 Tax=Mucilaginibacter rivuli TaxID=2857527 RepID=UPI001C5D6FD5|nr:hypothetical protein [Mucilaginibacter rivuli]MBW4888457.1 hypothetical protein [Mucilaginibacter rivuli]